MDDINQDAQAPEEQQMWITFKKDLDTLRYERKYYIAFALIMLIKMGSVFQ